MKRSILNLLGGLLLCLPMLFTSCSEKDNSLEQIVNQPNLEGLQKALYKNAEIKVKYYVYNGADEGYTATIKNVGTIEEPKYEVQGGLPAEDEIKYKLTCDMGYVDDNLYFGLVYNKKVTDEGDESEDMFDLAPVMVVKFDTKTSKYDVYALPGFDFEVISINGANIDVTEASTDKAKIGFKHEDGNILGLSDYKMEINLNGVSTWEKLDDAYDEVGLGVFGALTDHDGDATDDTGNMIIDLSDYDFYFNADDADYWKVFVIHNEEGSEVQKNTSGVAVEKTYTAIDYKNIYFIPCYGLNTRGNIALLDVLKLQLPATTPFTWKTVAQTGHNDDYLKLVFSGTKLTVVCDGTINDNGKGYYYGLYDGVHSVRVDAEVNFDNSLDYHFYQLRSAIKGTDTPYEDD